MQRVFVTRNLDAFPLAMTMLGRPTSSSSSLLQVPWHVDMWQHSGRIPRAELIRGVAGASAILCLLTEKIDAEVLDAAGPSLRLVSTMSVGYDHIDIQECRRRGIRIGFTPDVLTEATAEITIGLLIAACRRFQETSACVRDGRWGEWDPAWMLGRQISGSNVGIIGLGRIGQSVAAKLLAFRPARILYWGPREKQSHQLCDDLKKANLEFKSDLYKDFLPECDHVIVTCQLNQKTRHLINKKAFMSMRSHASLINTARGPVVHQQDLVDALQERLIGVAGLDVTDPEPLPLDSPLLTLNNCLVLPHIGSATVQTRSAMAQLAAQNIVTFLKEGRLVKEVL